MRIQMYILKKIIINQIDEETWILLKSSVRGFSTTLGLLHFPQQVSEDSEAQGTFLYPDWVTCLTVSSGDKVQTLLITSIIRVFGQTSLCRVDATAILEIL